MLQRQASHLNVSVKTVGPNSVEVSWKEPAVYYQGIESYTVTYWLDQDRDNSTMQAVEPDQYQRVLEKLRQGVQYGVTVQAATQSSYPSRGVLTGNPSEPVYFTVNYLSPDPATDMTTTQNNSFNTTPPNGPNGSYRKIVGLVFALAYVLALIIVGLTFILIRKRKKDQMVFEKHAGNGVPPAFAKPDEDEDEDDMDVSLIDDLEEPPIPISKFETHVIANHADSDGGFAAEYEDIQRMRTPYTSVGSAELTNKHKNRYTNIVAYDHSRVKLQTLPNQPYSDYINANYVDGYNRQRAFIAAQGPLKATFDDFWRMIWEQQTMVIVMITKLEERGRRKCDRYWPAKGNPERYGDIEVTLEHKEKFASYTIRTFLLKYKHKKAGSLSPRKEQHGKPIERIITQFHFTDWPDHGVPAYTLPVLAFIQKSSALNPHDAGPMVVHCSAGVGRTGTYIVIDSMMKQMHAEGKINVFGFLKRIRTQRNYLVQTEEQYVFIHDVLLDWLKVGNTRIRAKDLKTYVDRMTLPNEQGKVLLDEQFRLMKTPKIHEYEFNKAKHPLNLEKNRNGVLPVERNRVSISCVAGVDGSDYINASFMQGYRGNREFIVTQYPKENTMVEFWRMLWETNSSTILMLSDKEDDETDDEPIFWPTNKEETLSFDTLTVTLCEEEHSNISFMTREFLVECLQDEDQLTVKQFHYSYWPDSCSPVHTAFDLVYALQERSASQERANKDNVGPIIVMDKYGGRQAATFCALYTLHQELQSEDAVDVFKTVTLYTAKRPGMFKTKDDYHYLFRALQSIYTAEQQLKSMRAQREDDKDWHMMRYQTSVHGTPGERDVTFANTLDSDGFYRTRSQTMASTGTTRQVRPSKFWHRRTKSEKRKPSSANVTNSSSLEITPTESSPNSSSPEVYELGDMPPGSNHDDDELNRSSILMMDHEVHAGFEPAITTAPEIHMNGVELTIDPEPMDTETDHCLELDNGSLLDDTASNRSSEGVIPDDELAEVSTKLINHHRHKSVESLGQQSSKSEDTYM
ncbi:receptor-type tyrosine-protein phosphatase alpha-like isoform X2 [Amphiura filiformis]|uniref:receptor-type tyrosine-protein phosphatase alpha-like isoform X2 n=1 Tax=Amphiura filiformis TaxID=82378 RepID=UPI003B216EA3